MKLALAAIVLAAGLPPSVHPWPIGVGPRYHPPAAPAAVRAGRPVGWQICSFYRHVDAAHLEVFASRRVVILPSGIGRGPRGCWYPASTSTPTGVVSLIGPVKVGDLFRVWAQALGPHRLLSFRGTTRAFVNGRRWVGDPRDIWLTDHAQVVLEIGGYVAPHPSYLFPKGTP
jgi:hypothetical protein